MELRTEPDQCLRLVPVLQDLLALPRVRLERFRVWLEAFPFVPGLEQSRAVPGPGQLRPVLRFHLQREGNCRQVWDCPVLALVQDQQEEQAVAELQAQVRFWERHRQEHLLVEQQEHLPWGPREPGWLVRE